MVITFLSWIYISFLCLTLGLAFDKFWCRVTGYSMESLEMYLLAGLGICTIYAQIFSLFTGVGLAANLLLLIACIGLLVYLKSGHGHWEPPALSVKNALVAAFSLIVILVFAGISARMPTHYDTYLYHAQAIRWVEEYGVVPGLGNLHNRFSYNSSFLVLQALFSFRFLAGSSMHSLNGYVSTLFTLYCIFSMKIFREKSLRISDGFRLALLLYILHGMPLMSSPNTDTFVLSLAAYILIKWCDFTERNETTTEAYGWLCLMAIYACTLKLSSAFLLLLLLKPLAEFLRSMQWKKLCFYALFSAVLAIPFFARNIMISGYLVYPYSSIDIIPGIDWKMDPDTLDYDKKEIIVWGRGTYDVATYGQPVSEWLPGWVDRLAPINKIYFYGAIFASIGICMTSFYLIRKKEYNYLLLSITIVACFYGWMFSAPLIRYGEIYLLLPIYFILLYWLRHHALSGSIGKLFLAAGICMVLYTAWEELRYVSVFPIAQPEDYCLLPARTETLQGISFYLPVEDSDQAGYHNFPSATSDYALNHLELRGQTVKEGFRHK